MAATKIETQTEQGKKTIERQATALVAINYPRRPNALKVSATYNMYLEGRQHDLVVWADDPKAGEGVV